MPLLHGAIERGARLLVPSLVLYEWWSGPRQPEELSDQEALFPSESALTFGPDEAARSARLYGALSGAPGREVDIAIAAHALVRDVPLWTLNHTDVADLPGLRLASP